MAALPSRPSLRSSNRQNPLVDEVPPAYADQNPLTNSRRGKHARNSSLAGQGNPSVKRLKLALPDPTRSRDASTTLAPKSLPIRDRSTTQDAATQATKPPKRDSPQHRSGITITTYFNDDPSLTLKTKDISNQNDKRSLRSHDGGSRSKSELALYFPNYDDLMSIEPKEPGRNSNHPDLTKASITDLCY